MSLRAHALSLAVRHGYEVFPLSGKVPAIAGGRGCLDATRDPEIIARWWTERPHANIGLRVPLGQVVLDVDPRHDGHLGLARLTAEHGALTATRTAESGRGDGGRHFHYLAPDGPLTSKQLPEGIDLKTRGGYVVAPPSIHPDSGQPYRWVDRREPAPMPDWLAGLIRRTAVVTDYVAPAVGLFMGSSIADDFSSSSTWAQVLSPHGWHCLDRDGDHDGARWRHPTATAAHSATVKHGCLFVYSPNTPFEVTEAADPHGYTRFHAFAVLNHGGDMSAAARALRLGVVA